MLKEAENKENIIIQRLDQILCSKVKDFAPLALIKLSVQ